MKIQLLGLSVAAATTAVLFATGASADVLIDGDLHKIKVVDILVDVDKDKDVFITPTAELESEGAAEALAVTNATLDGNTVAPSDRFTDGVDENGLPIPHLIELDALIENSIQENTGVLGVNQDVGNMVNQGNAVAFAETDAETAFAQSEAWADQVNTNNSVTELEQLARDEEGGLILDPDLLDPDKTATIEGSVNGNTGVVGLNQNAGNMNNQHTNLALTVGIGSQAALSDAGLGQINSTNTMESTETYKLNTINASLNDNQAIVMVNQSVGNMNNQGASIAFSALSSTASVTVPGS